MNDRHKVILLIFMICLVIILSYINFNLIVNNNSQSEFNKTIKQASNIENISDIEYDKFYNKSVVTTQESISAFNNKTKYIDDEIEILQSFKNKSDNDTYNGYIDIQIKRLTSEKETYTYLIKDIENYENYKNRSINSTQALRISNLNKRELEKIDNNTFTIKNDCENYLNIHPVIKELIISQNLDDDFYLNNRRYSNIMKIN